MHDSNLVKEAERVMKICNACRYCEGFCAVFPAMERRRNFSERDLMYLSNLCHNCRGCYYACQYAPPHEFDLNVPKALGNLRLETYSEFVRPKFLAGLFRHNGRWVSLISMLSVLLIVLLTFLVQPTDLIVSAHSGEDAFYRVIPYAWIVLPFTVLGLLLVASLLAGMTAFWRKTGDFPREVVNLKAHVQAIWDVLRLKYLDGGGYGCNYPDDRFSMTRRWLHHSVFYGFILCFVATTIAAIYHHFLGWSAPYEFWSWPVLLGTAGGLSLLAGTAGLLFLKTRMDKIPAATNAFPMDVSFLFLLFFTTLSGLLLLVLRETAVMGTMLAIHLGLVLALFITLPYGKFVHAGYRYVALFRNAVEEGKEE